MFRFPLPPHIDDIDSNAAGRWIPAFRECVITGGNGAGKTRFFMRLFESFGKAKILLSTIADSYPARFSMQLDPLISQLVLPENEEKLSRMSRIWEQLFAGSTMKVATDPESSAPELTFSSPTGNDRFCLPRLSRGEKAAFYMLAGAATAPDHAVIFVDSPTLFLHPTTGPRLWDAILQLRPDCRMVYDTNDALFTASRRHPALIWVRSYRPAEDCWEYQIVTEEEGASDDLMLELLGSRRSILFIEGDATHSIDFRLYSSAFPEYTVRPVGSCDKVIESVRTFSSLRQMHRLESHGLVDRDRRSGNEVEYLRSRGVMVPEVAEVENIFLSPEIVSVMSSLRGKNPEKVLDRLRKHIFKEFERNLEMQALEHTRHRMKRDVERKIDARFTCITALELHIRSLINRLRPRDHYNQLVKRFRRLLSERDYEGVLQVFNHKPLLSQSCLLTMLGYKSVDQYIDDTLKAMRRKDQAGEALREGVRKIFIPQREAVVTESMPSRPGHQRDSFHKS